MPDPPDRHKAATEVRELAIRLCWFDKKPDGEAKALELAEKLQAKLLGYLKLLRREIAGAEVRQLFPDKET